MIRIRTSNYVFSFPKTAISTALSGLIMTAASTVSATVIVSDNSSIAASTYVAPSGQVNGAFNIASLLNGQQILSASVTANFEDNTDQTINTTFAGSYQITNSYTYSAGSYCCGLSTCTNFDTDYYYTRTVTTDRLNPIETASLTFGGAVVNVSSDAFSTYTDNGYVYDGASYYGNGYDYYYSHNYTYDYGNKGAFSTTFDLNSAALSDLNTNGLLNFTVAATAGDFLIDGITLNATLGDVVSVAQVPEPGSLALLGLGVIAFSLNTRKRRSNKN